MDLRNILRSSKGADEADPEIKAIAEAIAHNLTALGLHVDSRPYGRRFLEIKASTSPKLITTPDGIEASGIALLLAGAYDPPSLVFEQINSLRRGMGRAMVEAVIAGATTRPDVFRRLRVNDLSPRLPDGRRWWEHVADAHPEFDWVITHEEPFNGGR
ncbi:MAG: hypothetical protein U1E20_01760 [Methylocystis sp.]|uniref:hypothetical protein n=1 Tax=Methylocystis sp. TaxID=1911079 RepID=UPI00392ABB29